MGTVWYAQNSSANVDSASMWNDAANGSGSTLTWANLDPTDTLRANGKTSVTINVNTTCAKIDTLTNGGRFVLADGITLTADVVAGTAYCLQFPSASDTGAIVGDVTASATHHSEEGVRHESTGTLTITGNVSGGGASGALGAAGIRHYSTGAVVVTGNVEGGSGDGCFGIYSYTAGSVTVTGNVSGGSHAKADGVRSYVAGSVTITGNVIGGSAVGACGVFCDNVGHVRIDGEIIANASGSAGLAARVVSIVDGANHYTDYAEADTTPGDVTGELIRHYGLGALPTPAEVAAAVWVYDGTAGRTLTG